MTPDGIYEYSDKIEAIDLLLSKNRRKWRLDAISYMDYDDVCQNIRLHIYKKWDMWDQNRQFEPWVNCIIINQIKNMVRNHYGNYTRPCLKCPHNLGSDLCGVTQNGHQNSECADYEKWTRRKESGYNLKMAVTEEHVSHEMHSIPFENINYEEAAANLHKLMMNALSPRNAFIYKLIYVDQKSDEEVCEIIGFKGDEGGRTKKRFKQLQNLKKAFFKLAQRLTVKENG